MPFKIGKCRSKFKNATRDRSKAVQNREMPFKIKKGHPGPFKCRSKSGNVVQKLIRPWLSRAGPFKGRPKIKKAGLKLKRPA
jgi:hypothetical protein